LKKIEFHFVQKYQNNSNRTKIVTDMATECAVCCEAYNKTTHTRTACEHSGACEFEACKACIRKYLLSTTNDPNCMQCNKAWSDKFLTKHMKATFMRNDYKTHRKELLVQQQISRLPETMAAAEHFKGEEVLQKVVNDLREEYNQASKQIRDLRYGKLEKEERKKELDAAHETFNLILANIRQAQFNLALYKTGERGAAALEGKEEARKFIMPCGNAECRGYLSTKYKCELCEHHTCAKCFEHLGLLKEEESGHECKPENIESAEFIRKQSKPCPCCGTRISKIDGCDQMWCTQCHKAFSWNTGKIVTGPVHNPHFYQYQREHGGLARAPGDVPCGGLPSYYDLNQKIAVVALPRTEQDFFYNTVMKIHRLQNHFNDTYMEGLRRAIPTENHYEKQRIAYILNRLSREELANRVFALDADRKKNVAILQVCEVFTTVGTDMFRRIIVSEKKGEFFATELKQRVAEYDTLRHYVNEQLKEISMTYGICVQQIKADWTNDNSKFNAKGETDQYIIKREKVREERKEKEEAKRKARQDELKERAAKYRAEQEAANAMKSI